MEKETNLINQVNLFRRILYSTLHLQSLYGQELSKSPLVRQDERRTVNHIKDFADNLLLRTTRISKTKTNHSKHAQVIDDLVWFLNDALVILVAVSDEPTSRERVLKKLENFVITENKKLK